MGLSGGLAVGSGWGPGRPVAVELSCKLKFGCGGG